MIRDTRRFAMSRKSGNAKKSVEIVSAGALIDKIIAVEDDVAKMTLQIYALVESSTQINKKLLVFERLLEQMLFRHMDSTNEFKANLLQMNNRMGMFEDKQSMLTRTNDARFLKVERASADALHRWAQVYSLCAEAKPEKCPSGPAPDALLYGHATRPALDEAVQNAVHTSIVRRSGGNSRSASPAPPDLGIVRAAFKENIEEAKARARSLSRD